jgi:hypothetical protein
MKHAHSQNCPLCGNLAEYHFADYENRKHFLCSNCTQFQISKRAEFRVAKGPTQWRAGLARLAAKHPNGHTLVITIPTGDDHRALKDEYIENSQLP